MSREGQNSVKEQDEMAGGDFRDRRELAMVVTIGAEIGRFRRRRKLLVSTL